MDSRGCCSSRCSSPKPPRASSWLPDLYYPIRVGEHDQIAFAFGLIFD